MEFLDQLSDQLQAQSWQRAAGLLTAAEQPVAAQIAYLHARLLSRFRFTLVGKPQHYPVLNQYVNALLDEAATGPRVPGLTVEQQDKAMLVTVGELIAKRTTFIVMQRRRRALDLTPPTSRSGRGPKRDNQVTEAMQRAKMLAAYVVGTDDYILPLGLKRVAPNERLQRRLRLPPKKPQP